MESTALPADNSPEPQKIQENFKKVARIKRVQKKSGPVAKHGKNFFQTLVKILEVS